MNRMWNWGCLFFAVMILGFGCTTDYSTGLEVSEAYEAGKASYAKRDFTGADSAFQLAFLEYEKAGDSIGMAKSLNNRAIAVVKGGGSIDTTVFGYWLQALELYRLVGDDSLAAGSAYNIGKQYKDQGIYDLAQEYLLEALGLMERTGNHPHHFKALSALGNVARKLEHLEQSIAYFDHADTLLSHMDYPLSDRGKNFLHRGQTLRDFERYDDAKVALASARDLFIQVSDTDDLASAEAQLGLVAIKMDELSEAEGFLQRSYAFRKEIRASRKKMASSLNHLAELRMAQHRFQEVHGLLDSAWVKIKYAKALDYQLDNLLLRSRVYEVEGRPDLALETYQQAVSLQDSLLGIRTQLIAANFQAKYGVEREKREKAKIAVENSELQLQLFVATSSGILLIGAVVFFVILYQRKRKEKQRIETLLIETNHRIKNNLQSLAGILLLEQQRLSDQDESKSTEILRDAQNRLTAMELIHQNLSVATEESLADIQLDHYLRDLVESILTQFERPDWELTREVRYEPLLLNANRVMRLGIIVNEVITNACKHGFSGKVEQPIIQVELRPKGHFHTELIIQDNGSGFNPKLVKHGALGLALIDELTRELGGEYSYQFESGTKFILKMPL